MKNEEIKVPSIGLGTFLAKGEDVKIAVKEAIKVGYRLIDTAAIYENETEIGEAIKESDIARSDLFITSKLWNDVSTFDETIKACEESCKRLGVEYLDLYLIHWSGSKERNAEVWRGMEKLLEDGKVRTIGVSNFQIHHLTDLMETATIMPMMNQVEVHPHLTQIRLQEFCMENGIPLTSYGSFARGHIDDCEVLKKIAKKHDATIQQVVLRWLFQRGIFSIPKSITPERINSNFQSGDLKLSLAEMESINGLNKARRYYGDPDNFTFGF